jgi:anti-sigma factor RsiW
MSCHDVQNLLHPYVDGELDLVRNLEIEEHLGTCPACAKQVANLRSLRARLSSTSLYNAAPAALRARVQLAPELPVPARDQPFTGLRDTRLRRVLTVAGVFCLIGLSATLAILAPKGNAPTGGGLEDAVIANHVRSLQVNHLTDVVSADRHTVKPWFRDKLDFSPQVPDLSSQGFPLAGGRLDYLAERPVAALIYQRGKHAINVFTWPSVENGDKPVRAFSRQGFHLREWRHSGMNYWAISDLNAEDLDQFVKLFLEHTAETTP